MDILQTYKSLLAAAGLHTTVDGFVQMDTPDGMIYATRNGKKLVIPTLEQQRSPHNKECLIFHPLSENTLQGENEVLGFFRLLLVARLNAAIGSVGMDLLTLAASTATHKDLSPDQAEFLSMLDEPDEHTVSDWVKLAKSMPANQVARAFVSMFLKKGGRISTNSYARVASVNFPLYKELEEWEKQHTDKVADKERGIAKKKGAAKGPHQIYDIPLREKDRPNLIGLMKYLVVQIDTPEAYYRGSNSSVAPSLDALMHSFRLIAGRLNDIIDLFEGTIPEIESFRFNADWVDAFVNLELLWPQIRNIPNQGGAAMVEAAPALPNTQAQLLGALAGSSPVHQSQPQAAPVAAYQPIPEPPKQMPWAALQNPPPIAQPQPLQWQPGQPQQAYNPYAQPQQQHQQQSPTQQSSARGGVSMAALMQNNPALAAAAYGVGVQQPAQFASQQGWPPQGGQAGWPPYGQPPPRY